jgi:hypothetical protein
MDSTQFALLVQEAQYHCATACFLLAHLNVVPVELFDALWEAAPGDDMTANLVRKDGTNVTYDLRDLLLKHRRNKTFNKAFLRTLFSGLLSYVYDVAKANGLMRQTPEYEFLRHLRNAVSHGNRFTLRKGEPTRPACFGNFRIDRSLNGMENVLFSYVKPGDTMDLLDLLRGRP